MNKVSILHYLVHVDLAELFIYLLPVLSLIALIKANSQLKRHVVTIQKTKKDRKRKNGLFTMVNVIILASIVGYMLKHEFPQKDYFYKKSITKKQIRFDQEHFLLTGDSK
jgi:predicted CDP-diglyceride synthetase/phosphatidate cytidylyltransferase